MGDVHSSMKTRINVQRQIMMESQQHQNENRLSSNTVSVSIEEYQHIQQQLNLFTELRNKYDIAQQQIINLQHQLSQYQEIKSDLNSSSLIPDHNDPDRYNEPIKLQMEQLVAYLHTKEQSLYDLRDEYEQTKKEKEALIANINQLENKIKSLIGSETNNNSMAQKIRTL